MKTFSAQTFSALVLCSMTVLSRAADADQIIAGWLARQTNIQTWAADFTQTRTLKTLANPLISTGQVWFAAPQNFRWELNRDQTIAIRNKETMLVLYPRFKRAEKYDFENSGRSEWKDALALLQSGFPRSRADLDNQFRVLSASETNSLVLLELQPKSPGARKMMPQINLRLTTDLTLAGTELLFIDGSRMRNDFRNVQTNVDVAGKFSLDIPPGFTLVEPMKKGKR
jgi:outer membrane lipoprotein-sorting protein